MMMPVRWTGRERGASLSNERCVLTSCNIRHRILGLGASAPRPARRYGPRSRAGLIRSIFRQIRSAWRDRLVTDAHGS
jgi:hypothetical protein